MRKPESVWVKNDGEETFKSKYDGDEVVIAPGKSEELTLPAAELLFGFGEEDKSRCLRRLGWMGMHLDYDKAIAMLNKFSFHMENPKYEQKHGKTADLAPGGDGEGGGTGKLATPPAAGVLGKLTLHRAAPAA